jgi:hypothetical protein
VSTLTLTLILGLVKLAHPGLGAAQGCVDSGAPAWSQQLRIIAPDCDIRVSSPDGQNILHIDTEGHMHLFETNRKVELVVSPGVIDPPAMVSWSPTSDAFFINDGEGSGESNLLRVYRVHTGTIAEDTAVESKAVALYRGQKGCPKTAADPNV